MTSYNITLMDFMMFVMSDIGSLPCFLLGFYKFFYGDGLPCFLSGSIFTFIEVKQFGRRRIFALYQTPPPRTHKLETLPFVLSKVSTMLNRAQYLRQQV